MKLLSWLSAWSGSWSGVKSKWTPTISSVLPGSHVRPAGIQSEVTLVLNPADAGLVRDAFSLAEKEQGWNIVEDPVLNRGGCKVIIGYLPGRCNA